MILAVLQARMSSSRLPGKVMLPLLGVPMIQRQIERILCAEMIDSLVVATSTEQSDDAIVQFCEREGICVSRGSLHNVLERFYHVVMQFNPTYVVRLTADCPLTDPRTIDKVIDYHLDGNYDYTSNTLQRTFPKGLDVEIVNSAYLKEAFEEAKSAHEKEHVTPFFYSQPHRYKLGCVKSVVDLSLLRWTVDTSIDYDLITHIYEELYPKKEIFSTIDILELLENYPELKTMNIEKE